jgi:hypothetical protein
VATVTAHTACWLSRADANAISLSSADHDGMKSSAGSFVSCFSSPLRTSSVQML